MNQRNRGVERRLDQLEQEVKRIRTLYERTLSYKDSDPETFLMHARKAAEAVCRNLFMEAISPNPGTLMLDGLIEKLNTSGVLPKAIALPLRTIQGYGNYAAHDQDEPAVITPEYIQPCLQALAVVVSWYFAEHKTVASSVAIPEASQHTEVRVSDFAAQAGLTSPSVIRLAREILHVELRTPSALLSRSQVDSLNSYLKEQRRPVGGANLQAPVRTFDLGSGIHLEFVLIPAGTFRMGSPVSEEGHNDDEVEHAVTMSRPLYIGRYPVTQAQYEAVVGTNPSYFLGPNQPVEMVSWFDAVSFCELLAERYGKLFRLPTESEWEYSCRAGTTTAFHVGDAITVEQANFDGRLGLGSAQAGCSRRSTTSVDAFGPNPWGLYDMHGNVWEWCADWYGAYPMEGVTDPSGPAAGDIRILRGGSWFHSAADARSAQRDALDPGRRHSLYGFRVVFHETSK